MHASLHSGGRLGSGHPEDDVREQHDYADKQRPCSDVLLGFEFDEFEQTTVLISPTPVEDRDRGGHDGDDDGQAQDDVPDHVLSLSCCCRTP